MTTVLELTYNDNRTSIQSHSSLHRIVIDPVDYIPFIGTNITVNGMKRGMSDTSGMLLVVSHIPLVGAFAMAPIIGHESMNFFSSQSVFSDGSRLSPKEYI